jgi:hypothetical protein
MVHIIIVRALKGCGETSNDVERRVIRIVV